MTDEEVEAACKKLAENTFKARGLDHKSYPTYFNTSIEKAIKTGMIHATIWSNWGGYQDFSYEIRHIAGTCKRPL